jgi:hypothetical protein
VFSCHLPVHHRVRRGAEDPRVSSTEKKGRDVTGSDFVCVREYESWYQAELAHAALLHAGIDALLQGVESGRLLGSLVPERFPVLVPADRAEAARELLQSLGAADPSSISLPAPKTRVRRWRVIKVILGFYVYTLLCLAALVLVAAVGLAIADAVHSSRYGHAIELPFEHGHVAIALALLLTFSRWVRDRGLIIVPIVIIVLVAAFMRLRTAPAHPTDVDTSRSRSLRWP